MRQSEAMLTQIRKKSICELVNAQGSVTVNALCDRFHVSPATVRNDLRDLEAKHMIERTHGGAVSNRKVVYEPNTEQKSTQYIDEKIRIAKAALMHIQPGDAIVLDSGTTTLQLAILLGGFERLTVVTYDLQIAAWLESNTNISIIMAGGMVRRNFHCTVGQTVVEELSAYHPDKLFLAANSISTNGLFTPSVEMAAIKSALIRSSDQVILLADSGKFGRKSFVRFGTPEDVQTLITDHQTDPQIVTALRNKGLQIELV